MIPDLGVYLHEHKQSEFHGTTSQVVIHDDPEGQHVTFLTFFNNRHFIGSVVTESLSEAVSDLLKAGQPVGVYGVIDKKQKFTSSGVMKELVIPLTGHLYELED